MKRIPNRANEELARMLLEGKIGKDALPPHRASFILWPPYLKQVGRRWGEELAERILEK